MKRFEIKVHETGEIIFDFGSIQSISIKNMKSVCFFDLFIYFLNPTSARTLAFKELPNQQCEVYGNNILLNKCIVPTRIMFDMNMRCYVTFWGFLPYRDKNTSNLRQKLANFWKNLRKNMFTYS